MHDYPEDRLPPHLVFTLFPACYSAMIEFSSMLVYKRRKYVWRSDIWLTQYFRTLLIDKDLIMPRAKKEQSNDKKSKTKSPVRWVNIPLPDHAELEITERWADELAVFSDMANAVYEGWTFTVKHDDRGEGYVSFAIGEFCDGVCEGVGLAGRGDTPTDALAVALYRITLYVASPTLSNEGVAKRRFR